MGLISVLMPNTRATLRRREEAPENSYGERVQGGWSESVGDPLNALIEQRGDGGWTLCVDEALWPVRKGDAVVDTEREWVFIVSTADHLVNVMDSTVNYVRCEGLRVSSQGTEPQDSWFVGREVE